MNEVILVEGLGDVDFVTGFLRKIGKSNVESFPPRPFGAPSNGIPNVVATIPVLVNKILAGEISKAAIVVDADYTGISGGFAFRRAEIVARLQAAGYTITEPTAGAQPGELFTHPDGHAPIGLFIFPNHRDDGMLEDLLKGMVVDPTYKAVLDHAVTVVNNPPEKFFNKIIHTAKAEIGTFLAWQKRPPAFTGVCIEGDIFLATSPAAADFRNWLERVF